MPVYKYQTKQKGSMWYVKTNYIDPDTGTSKQACKRGFKTKKEALEYERTLLQNASKTPVEASTRASELTFEDVYTQYKEAVNNRKLKADTMITKESIMRLHILEYFKTYPIKSVSTDVIKQWQNSFVEKNFTPTYLRTIQAQLNAVLNYAVKKHYIEYSPMVDIASMGTTHAPEKQIWSIEEYKTFSEAIKKLNTNAYLLCELCYWLGLRRGEALAITPDDIVYNAKQSYLVVSKSCNAKGIVSSTKTPSSNRTIAIPKQIEDEIKDEIKKHYDIQPTDRIITISMTELHRVITNACKISGVKQIRIHDMRHSYASILINCGQYSTTDIARSMGHSSAKTTLRTYAHMLEDTKNDIADTIEKLHE